MLEFCDAEVHELRADHAIVPAREEDVLRLEVAVHDPLVVGRGKRIDDGQQRTDGLDGVHTPIAIQ